MVHLSVESASQTSSPGQCIYCICIDSASIDGRPFAPAKFSPKLSNWRCPIENLECVLRPAAPEFARLVVQAQKSFRAANGHRSEAMVLRYIRNVDLFKDNAAQLGL